MTTVNSGGRALVVGGHGAVGATVTATLDEWFPGRVLAAGRSRGVRVDVTDPDAFGRTLDDLGDVTAVVLCVEPPDTRIARLCLTRGIHLVDIGATPHLLDGVAALHGSAAEAGATAVLSVGVAPGLTNLLAARADKAVGGADRIDLTVLLGSGERHGEDAVRWTVEGLARPAGTARAARVPIPGHGTRTARPFPFSDQHTLRGTLGVPEVTTRMCLDSTALTSVVFAIRRLARHPRMRDLMTGAFRRVHIGGEDFAVRADARRGDRHAAYALTGRAQSRVTALVAAHTTRAVLTGALPPGVHHIEELPALAGIPEALAADGVTAHGPLADEPADGGPRR
ncbi:saccharopine dehydrogenase [Streptomyces sp. MUM 203J]|uniref:saccharopine dehydrogenase n=1 Tax=Streptomyces sp. MUM 203J TaxID=2791990 RepID=UPI001F0495FE|nr:saccharopine dehydrogenase [Streptomyces sp. MUM 203J]MCH0540799.1 saccharopine dehydrogenase [Streptomyces sp. MUM 203J]